MARAGASRQQVELLDAPELDVPEPRRRVRWWWVALPVALVAVLVVVQGVVDARERAALAGLSGLPGLVSPVEESVGVRWSPGTGTGGMFSSAIQADGAVVGLVHGYDASQEVVAFDERTGARRWSTPLLAEDPDAVRTPRGAPVGGCQRAGDVAVCLVTDTYMEYGNAPPELVQGGNRSSVVVLDLHDGHVVARRPAPGVASLAVLPGLVVTGRPTPGGGLSVVAADLRTGDVRWRYAAGAVPVVTPGTVFPVVGRVGVWMPPGEVTLLDPDGAVVRADADARIRYEVEPATGALIVSSTDASGQTISSDVRAGPVVTYPGTRIELSVDDGSVPGLVLTSGPTVAAYDRDTGRLRWTLAREGFGDALVLLGRVYLLTSDGVVAVDGSSGAEIWRAPVSDGAILRNLFSDGHHLLATERHDGRTGLAAYTLDTGHEDWRTTLPDPIDSVAPMGHLLIGFSWGTPSVLGSPD